MPDCNTPDENALVLRARSLIAQYEEMGDMIRLGAYRVGSDPKIDEAIKYRDALEGFVNQAIDDRTDLATGYDMLREILSQ